MYRNEYIDPETAKPRIVFHIRLRGMLFITSIVLLLMLCSYYLGYQYNHQQWSHSAIAKQLAHFDKQSVSVENVKDDVLKSLQIFSQKTGSIQQQLQHLHAVSNHLAKNSGLDEIEFKINTELTPEALPENDISSIDLLVKLDTLNQQIQQSQTTMLAMQDLLQQQELIANQVPSIMPIKAYVSSWFGWRDDPLKRHSRRTFHEGMDFSADIGTEIKSVAAGIITWSGPRDNYGNLVEIDHGNGYITRYAHINELFVTVGEKVTKGQLIASVGNTGRTTGPHLHFEVEKDGAYQDPKKYMTLN